MENTFMATLTAECCRLTDHAHSSIPTTHSILKALLQAHVNSIAVVPQQHMAASDRIAVAVYPTASLMNHSCIPNIALAFDGSKLVARPIKALQPGTPVLHCYGPQKGAEITPVRQKLVQENYFFQCCCTACQKGFDHREQAMVALRCLDKGCRGNVVPKRGLESWITSRNAVPAGLGDDTCSTYVDIVFVWFYRCLRKVHSLKNLTSPITVLKVQSKRWCTTAVAQ